MDLHPAATLAPDITGAEYEALREAIREQGLLVPIKTYEGRILDGRNRFRACVELGLEPRFDAFHGTEEQAVLAAVNLNLARRQMSTGAKAMYGVRLKEYQAELAKKRQSAVGGAHPGALVEKFPQAVGKARDLAAKALGISGKTIDAAEKVMVNALPAIVQLMASGEMSVNQAVNVSKLSKSAQKTISELKTKPLRQTAVAAGVRKSEALKKRWANDGKEAMSHIKQAADAPGTEHVRYVLSRLEHLTNEIQKSGLGGQGYAQKFATEFDLSDPLLCRRLAFVATAIECVASLSIIAKRAERQAA